MPSASPIVNTSPLLYLHQVGRLDILTKLYGTVVTPAAVEQELAVGGTRGVDVPDLRLIDWLRIQPIESESTVPNVIDLGRGEAEVIALGRKTTDSLLIIDDSLGRQVAASYKLRCTGTLGVLIKAKQAGCIPTILPVISELQEKGLWLTVPVIRQALKLAGEEIN